VKCKRPFEGVLEAVRCPFCAAILFRNATECYHCGRKVPSGEAEASEESYFEKLLDSTRHALGADDGAGSPPRPGETPPDSVVFRLSEPFQKILLNRKKRLEQMDALVARARRRIRMLEASNNPIEIREREELKRQIEEILVEREDIIRIEEGIVEMERIYRNILTLQQAQLRDREDALKGRMEAFRKELERRELEKAEIKEREADLNRREDEFRSMMDRLRERERGLEGREARLSETIKALEDRTRQIAAKEDEVRKRIQIAGVRTGPEEITIQTPDAELRDLHLRITELEEQMEGVVEEKNRLREKQEKLSALHEDVKVVLKTLDELLEKLPEAEIKKFAKSKDFSAYEKVLDSFGL
jgi:chromosome segregation protein